MQVLKQRILADGEVKEGNILKVDSFLNHQIDPVLYEQMAEEFAVLFKDSGANKIATIEASGIGLACFVGHKMGLKVLFAKKNRTKNIAGNVYKASVKSYTSGQTYEIFVSKRFLDEDDRVLIIDDFLARGQAVLGLMNLCEQAGAEVVGCGIAIEKGFQDGGRLISDRGIKLCSLAVVESMRENEIVFRD